MTQSTVAKWFIEQESVQAVKRAGLPYDHPVRALLESSAEIVGVRQGVVRVRSESGELVTLDERIKELKSDPRYTDLFPQPEARVAQGDAERLRESFDAIAAGKVEVE